MRRRPPGCCHIPTFTLFVTPTTEAGWIGGESVTLELEVCGCWLDDPGSGNTFTLYSKPSRDEDAVQGAIDALTRWADQRDCRIYGAHPSSIDDFQAAYEAGSAARFTCLVRPYQPGEERW